MTMTYPFDFADYLDEFDDVPVADSIRHIYDRHTASFPKEISLDFDVLTDHNRCIAVLLECEDVLTIRPDLTEEQAWVVLQTVRRKHDATFGLTWEVVDTYASDLFPETTQEEL